MKNLQQSQPLPRSSNRAPAAAKAANAAILLAVSFAAATAASPSAPPVILHLRNGDRITGEILRDDAKGIVIRSPIAGKLTVARDAILRREVPGGPTTPLTATNPTVTNATVATTPPSVPKAPVATAAAPVSSPTNAPAQAISLSKEPWLPAWISPFLTNWHGNVGLGMNLGFGTTERQTFFVSANATHAWQRVANSVNYNAAYGLVNEVEAANRMEGMLKTDVFVDSKRHLYAYNLMLGGYDAIRLINRRLEEGVGMGYRVYERPRLIVNVELGGQYQRFDYAQQEDRSIWSGRISENLVWKPSDKFNVTQKLQFMPNVSDPSDYRVRFDLIASYPLFKRITMSLNAINEYESLPPRGVDNNDLQITTNVNITF
jgi:hypothetical protein